MDNERGGAELGRGGKHMEVEAGCEGVHVKMAPARKLLLIIYIN